MKAKRHNIGRVALAIALIMLITLLPHHHHEGGAICYVAEVCHEDGRVNDSHTQHHGDTSHCYWHKVNIVKTFAQSNLHFLPLSFWQKEYTHITHYIVSPTTRGGDTTMYVCTYSKHCPRRGPPLIG